MRISDWSSDVCSSDLKAVGQLIAARLDDVGAEQPRGAVHVAPVQVEQGLERVAFVQELHARGGFVIALEAVIRARVGVVDRVVAALVQHRRARRPAVGQRSEEHTPELQSLMRISYAVFCLKKKKTNH